MAGSYVNRVAPRGRHFVRAWRDHRGLSQEQLAERIDTTAATISRLEKGVSGYSDELLDAISWALRCTPADLLAGPPDAPDSPLGLYHRLDPDDREHIDQMILRLARAPRHAAE